MAFDNRDSIDFGKDAIPHLFRSIFIPTLLGMMADVTFILVDGIFVGHGVGAEGLAGINLVCPAMMLITGLGVMFRLGGSVVSAIHLAKENVKAARINVTQAFISAIAFALLVIAILYAFPTRIMRLFGVSDHLMPLAREYYMWFVPTCFFIMIQIVGSFIIRLDGSPKYSMMATAVPAVINIALDYTFIFPCRMGLQGAALATDIGSGVGAVMVFVYMFGLADKLKFYRLKRTATSLRLSLRNVGYMVKVGFSGFVAEFAASVMILVGNLSFGKYLGDTGIAAYSVICYIYPLLINIFLSVASSAQPIISFNHGANDRSRVAGTFRYSVLFSMGFAAVMMTLFLLFSPTVIAAFLERGTETFALAALGLPLFALGFIPNAFNISAVGYFQSTERNGISTVLTLLRGYIFVIIAYIALPLIFGPKALWLAVPVAEALTAVFSIILIKRSIK